MRKRLGIACWVCLSLAITIATPSFGAGHRSIVSYPWKALEHYGLGSVSWSPDGKKIAFVAANWADDDGYGYVHRDSIWILSDFNNDHTPRLRRLVGLKDRSRASSVFWIDSTHLGWATTSFPRYTFMQMGLSDRKPKHLVNRTFDGSPGSDVHETTPTDVFYDRKSRSLLFSGVTDNMGNFVRILNLTTRHVRNLSIPCKKYPAEYIDAPGLCGSVVNPRKPVFYIAAWKMSDSDGGCFLWRSDSYALRQDKLIFKEEHESIIWPRLSARGTLLACIMSGNLGLFDLETSEKKILAKRAMVDSPAPYGCPFSWSPDGKSIAYADGPRIKIVKVTAP